MCMAMLFFQSYSRVLMWYHLTCRVLPGRSAEGVFKVRHGLVAQMQVVVSSLVQQITAFQVRSDNLLFGHSSRQEVHRQQWKTHLHFTQRRRYMGFVRGKTEVTIFI